MQRSWSAESRTSTCHLVSFPRDPKPWTAGRHAAPFSFWDLVWKPNEAKKRWNYAAKAQMGQRVVSKCGGTLRVVSPELKVIDQTNKQPRKTSTESDCFVQRLGTPVLETLGSTLAAHVTLKNKTTLPTKQEQAKQRAKFKTRNTTSKKQTHTNRSSKNNTHTQKQNTTTKQQ